MKRHAPEPDHPWIDQRSRPQRRGARIDRERVRLREVATRFYYAWANAKRRPR